MNEARGSLTRVESHEWSDPIWGPAGPKMAAYAPPGPVSGRRCRIGGELRRECRLRVQSPRSLGAGEGGGRGIVGKARPCYRGPDNRDVSAAPSIVSFFYESRPCGVIVPKSGPDSCAAKEDAPLSDRRDECISAREKNRRWQARDDEFRRRTVFRLIPNGETVIIGPAVMVEQYYEQP